MGAAYYLYSKKDIELSRWFKYDREVNFREGRLNSEYFVNRGGVVLRKSFEGFESIHKNNDDLMAWYKGAYPQIFSPQEEAAAPPAAKPDEGEAEAE